MELDPIKIGVLASGSGSTAEAVATDIYENPGYFNFEIGLVITNNPDAQVLQRVEHWNRHYGFETETAIINNTTHPKGKVDRGISDEASEAMTDKITTSGCKIVACLGYMMILHGRIMDEYGFDEDKHSSPYEARMTNNHPGPLPLSEDTFGPMPSEIALEAYKKGSISHSHFSFHVVANDVDRGPIILQKPVPILPDDTPSSLFARTQLVEKAVTAHAINDFLEEKQATLLNKELASY